MGAGIALGVAETWIFRNHPPQTLEDIDLYVGVRVFVDSDPRRSVRYEDEAETVGPLCDQARHICINRSIILGSQEGVYRGQDPVADVDQLLPVLAADFKAYHLSRLGRGRPLPGAFLAASVALICLGSALAAISS